MPVFKQQYSRRQSQKNNKDIGQKTLWNVLHIFQGHKTRTLDNESKDESKKKTSNENLSGMFHK
jgi:hypothetical protein